MESVLNMTNDTYEYKWVRSSDGLVAGVCAGLGRRFGLEPWLVRLLWLVSVMALGTGLLLYAVLAYSLPREDRLAEAHDKRFLGVCARVSEQIGMEVGLVRTLCVFMALASLGATVVGYVVLHFVIPVGHRSAQRLTA